MNHRENNLHFTWLVCPHDIQLKIGLLTNLTLPNLPANDDTVDLVAYLGNFYCYCQDNITLPSFIYWLEQDKRRKRLCKYMKGKIVNAVRVTLSL